MIDGVALLQIVRYRLEKRQRDMMMMMMPKVKKTKRKSNRAIDLHVHTCILLHTAFGGGRRDLVLGLLARMQGVLKHTWRDPVSLSKM